jgi:acetyl esterase/lipase
MSSDDILTLKPPPADARIPYGAAAPQFGDLRLPKARGPHPIMMNIHGGFWRSKYDLAHAGHLCAALANRGIATWNLEYRRVGDEGGGWPGTFEDILNGFRFLPELARRYNLAAGRTAVMGHSAGGQLALCLAAHESTVKHAVSLAGVIDLRRAWDLHLSSNAVAEFLGGPPNQVPEHYKEAEPLQLSIPKVNQWVIHGTDDDVVPVDFARTYEREKKKRREDVHLLEIAKAGHFDLIDPRSAAWSKVEETVLTCVGK